MARLHGSFVLRWWVLDRGGSRIELEHVQSGARAVTRSLAEALRWIERGAEEPVAADDPAEPEVERGVEKGGAGGTSDQQQTDR